MTIFHIAHEGAWDAALSAGEYRESTRDRTLDEVGFIHSSTAEQLPVVAELFYRDDPEQLLVLEIDEAALGGLVKYEDIGNGELYPHIYGPLPTSAVTSVTPAYFEDDGGFVLESPVVE